MTKDECERSISRPVRRLLAALARTSAQVALEPADDGSVGAVRVVKRGSMPPDVIHRATGDIWRRALTAGLVEQLSDSDWVLSEAGLKALASATGTRSVGVRHVPLAPVAACGLGAVEDAREHRKRSRPLGEAQADTTHVRGVTSPAVNEAESPLGWLARRKDRSGAPLISQQQFEAGERLRADFERAALQPRVTLNWSALGSGGRRRMDASRGGTEIADAALAARARVNAAITAVGPDLSGLLLDICCHLKGLEQIERASGWPQRSAKIVLQIALTALARHYRLLPIQGEQCATRPATVRHWGADGYRPSVEAPLSDQS
ncbi:MAG: DUF6456 domain-containing protein [Hyphomicrobiaceae bacterium]